MAENLILDDTSSVFNLVFYLLFILFPRLNLLAKNGFSLDQRKITDVKKKENQRYKKRRKTKKVKNDKKKENQM